MLTRDQALGWSGLLRRDREQPQLPRARRLIWHGYGTVLAAEIACLQSTSKALEILADLGRSSRLSAAIGYRRAVLWSSAVVSRWRHPECVTWAWQVRRFVVRRWAGWAILLAVAVVLCGCSGLPWVSHSGRASSCGPPAQIRVAGHVMSLGDCGVLFLFPPPTVTMHVGQELDFHVIQGPNSSGTGLGPIYPLPHSFPAWMLTRVNASTDGSTARYRAMRPGRAELFVGWPPTAHCLASKRATYPRCPILQVTVIP